MLSALKRWEAITKDVCAYPDEATLQATLAASYPASRSALRTLDERVTAELAKRDAAMSALTQRIAKLEPRPAPPQG